MKSNTFRISSMKFGRLLTFFLGFIIFVLLFYTLLIPEAFAQGISFIPERLSTTMSTQTVTIKDSWANYYLMPNPEVYIRKRNDNDSSTRLREAEIQGPQDLAVEIPDPWLRSPGELELMVRDVVQTSHFETGWLCCITVEGRPIPEEPISNSAEFSIERVYRRDDVPIGIRDTLKVAVVIKNNGRRSGSVKAGVVDLSPGNVYIEGTGVTIPSQQQREINLDIPIDPQLIRRMGSLGIFTTTFFLLDPNATTGYLEQIWRDSNSVNNDLEVDFLLTKDLPHLRKVTVDIDSIKVKDDCDEVSVGEWILFFTLEGKNIVGGRLVDSFAFPENRVPREVDTGETIEISKELTLNRVNTSEDITLTINGIECDSDSWLPTIYVGRDALNIRCNGEHFPELSGANDKLGPATIDLNSAEFRASSTLRIHADRNDSCGSAFSALIHINP